MTFPDVSINLSGEFFGRDTSGDTATDGGGGGKWSEAESEGNAEEGISGVMLGVFSLRMLLETLLRNLISCIWSICLEFTND